MDLSFDSDVSWSTEEGSEHTHLVLGRSQTFLDFFFVCERWGDQASQALEFVSVLDSVLSIRENSRFRDGGWFSGGVFCQEEHGFGFRLSPEAVRLFFTNMHEQEQSPTLKPSVVARSFDTAPRIESQLCLIFV